MLNNKIIVILLFILISLKPFNCFSQEQLSEYQLLEKTSHIERKTREIDQIKLEKKFYSDLMAFRSKQMDHNITILKWQHYSGIGVFFLVIFLVIGGFYLSFLQFKRDEKSGQSSEATIEASKSGIKLHSSVIGLVILFMSFGFFYLYIKDVYTLKPIKLETNSKTVEQSTQ